MLKLAHELEHDSNDNHAFLQALPVLFPRANSEKALNYKGNPQLTSKKVWHPLGAVRLRGRNNLEPALYGRGGQCRGAPKSCRKAADIARIGFWRLDRAARRIKKTRTQWFGLNPPKEEVEETETSIANGMVGRKNIYNMKPISTL
jgi:hypothetical protein